MPQPSTTGGIALGRIPDAEIEQQTLHLRPAMSCCFTPTALWTRSTRRRRSSATSGWLKCCCASRPPAEDIADAIDTAVRAFAGETAPYDDLTLIVVTRK